jgi:exodeoxyribonuclease VII small subunit
MEKEKEKIGQSLEKLEKIVSWFDGQEEVDVEEGLKKVKEGAELIKKLKEKLKKVENEFEEVKKELKSDEE